MFELSSQFLFLIIICCWIKNFVFQIPLIGDIFENEQLVFESCSKTIQGSYLCFLFQKDRNSWRIIFIISAMLYLVAAAVYLFCGSSTTQWWDRIKHTKETEAYVVPADIIRQDREGVFTPTAAM